MKNYLTIIAAVLILCTWLAGLTVVEGSWWDKGLNIFKSISSAPSDNTSTEPSHSEIGDAFKQALKIGTENVVSRLGSIDGFNADPSIHIPLPKKLNTVRTMLSKVGMSQHVDDLELKLNRAAESATPKAKKLFMQAISNMTFDDVMNIYKGPENSATEYFKSSMSPPLEKEMKPIVENTLSEVGAMQAYDNVIGKYKTLPFVPDVKSDLTEHVIQKGMDGIFYYIAKEEVSIRKDPTKQTTALLKKVFGVK